MKMCLRVLFAAIMLTGSAQAAEEVSAVGTSTQKLASINATQLKLHNGMIVCLKSTDFETDEVYFKLGALGGFGILDGKERPSAEFAAQAAWESGMGGMTSDQLSVFLYEHELEFEPRLNPFSRFVEGEGTKDSVRYFLQCVQMLFMQHAFTQAGWETALGEAKSILSKQANDYDHVFEAEFLKLNTQSLPALRPINIDDLKKADYEIAKRFFQRSFSDPSDFICVIVGNFDVQEVSKLVDRYLGTIPKAFKASDLNKSISAPFPPGITKATIRLGNQPSSLTKLTFPLQVEVKEKNIYEIAFICQIIEARLKRVITEKMELSYGMDVSYEFPVYPYLNNPWISIRFRCDQKDIDGIKGIILSELTNMQTEGVLASEIKAVKKLELGSQEFWLKDNFYWVSMLLNYYLWGWNPERVDYKNTSLLEISPQSVDLLLKQSISLSNYSIFTALSEED